MREKDGLREEIASIREKFPQKQCLTIKDVCAYTGFGKNRAIKAFAFVRGERQEPYITITQFARQLMG